MNERENITTNNTFIRREIIEYYKIFYGNKIEGLEEMDKLFERHKVPNFIQEKNSLNNSIPIKVIEFIVKNLLKIPGTNNFTNEFCQTFVEEISVKNILTNN